MAFKVKLRGCSQPSYLTFKFVNKPSVGSQMLGETKPQFRITKPKYNDMSCQTTISNVLVPTSTVANPSHRTYLKRLLVKESSYRNAEALNFADLDSFSIQFSVQNRKYKFNQLDKMLQQHPFTPEIETVVSKLTGLDDLLDTLLELPPPKYKPKISLTSQD